MNDNKEILKKEVAILEKMLEDFKPVEGLNSGEVWKSDVETAIKSFLAQKRGVLAGRINPNKWLD